MSPEIVKVLVGVVLVVWTAGCIWVYRRLKRQDDEDEAAEEAERRRRALGHSTQLDDFRSLHRHTKRG